MPQILGALCLIEMAVIAWLLWTNRASALPRALEDLAKKDVELTESVAQSAQLVLDKQVLVKEADAQRLRADKAEAALHDLEDKILPLLHGTDLLDQFNRLRQPMPDAGDAAAPAGDGDAAPAGVQRGPAVVDPWAGDRG